MTKSAESAQQIALDFQLDASLGENSAPPPAVLEAALSPEKLAYAPVQVQTGEPGQKCREATNTYVQANLNLKDLEAPATRPWSGTADGNTNQDAVNQSGDQPDGINPELLAHGSILFSPGGHFTYRVIGACCRLFDRNELPWPCCRIQWRSKEPSWRRIGKRFVPDLATKSFPSYSVEILDHDASPEPVVVTLYWRPLSAKARSWWYQRYAPSHPGERV